MYWLTPVTDWTVYNDDQRDHKEQPVSWSTYVTTADFWEKTLQNWQSEFLAVGSMAILAVYLRQRGSPESKELGKSGRESDEEQKVGEHATEDSPRWARVGGLRTRIYSHSLVIVMTAIWLLTWFAQLVTGRIEYNAEQLDHHEAPLSLLQYAGASDFWNRTLQNWQSEFLAVASMIVFSIWLRQRGSPESKPVGSPHASTGVEG